jgi:hypothetical protein
VTDEQPADSKLGRDRVRSLARPALDILDRRFEQVHRHLDEVATRLEHSDDLLQLRQLFSETLAELRAQSQTTLELARQVQGFADSLAIRLDAIASEMEEHDGRRADG